MRSARVALWIAIDLACVGYAQKGSTPPAARTRPLVLTDAIPLEGIKGRFDHFGYGRGRVFAAALGSNAVVVVSVGARTLEHTISGVPDPQGVVYVPETNKVFVASGSPGKGFIFDRASVCLITTVAFSRGAHNMRDDPATNPVHCRWGDDAYRDA